MEKTRQLTTTALMVALSVVLSLIIYFLPILQMLMFVSSVPLMYIGIKYNIKIQSLGALAFFLIMMLIDPLYAVMLLGIVVPLSLIQGYLIKKNKSTSQVIFLGALGTLLGMIVYVYIMDMIFQINLLELFKEMMDELLVMVRQVYDDMGTLDSPQIQDYLAVLEEFKSYFSMIIPSLLVYFSLMASVLSFVFARTIFKRFKIRIPMNKFKDFRIDEDKRFYLVIIMIVVTIASIIDKGNMSYYAFNFISILILLLQISGLALIWFVTENHPNRKALRVITIIMFIVSPAISLLELLVRYGLAAVGFFDMYVDFRKRINNNQKNG